MTENNLYFFEETCDKKEIKKNLYIDTLGASPTTLHHITDNITNTHPNNKLFKYGNEIDKSSMLKADTYDELMAKIAFRLARKYTASKVRWIWKIQSLFNKHEIDILDNGNVVPNYTSLFKELKFTIEKKAEWYAKTYKSSRLSSHDFEAELYDITYQAVQYYEQAGDLDTEFTLVETLELYWTNRLKSFIKSCLYTKKKGEWFTALPLADDFDNLYPDTAPSPEQQYILKETVTNMFNDSDLTDKERQLLKIIYDYPNGSLREWGDELNIGHPQTVKRLFQSLQKKLKHYGI